MGSQECPWFVGGTPMEFWSAHGVWGQPQSFGVPMEFGGVHGTCGCPQFRQRSQGMRAPAGSVGACDICGCSQGPVGGS